MALFNFVKHNKNSKPPINPTETNAARPDCSEFSPAELLIRYIDCAYKLIHRDTDISEINKIYTSALRYGAENGCTPVIIPVTKELINILGKNGEMTADISLIREMRRALLWQTNDSAGEIIIESAYYEKTVMLTANGIDINNFEHSNAQGATVNGFHSFVSKGKTTSDVILAQIPTVNPWEVFIWLPIGEINGAPSDNELIAVSKLWHEMCGAVPAVITHDAVEYFIPRGRPNVQTAEKIAKGHFAMCPDRVMRMTHSHTIGELTDTLTKSCVWYLGWKQ